MKKINLSLKLKLTLWYSLMLILLYTVFVFGLNLVATNYLRKEPKEEAISPFFRNHPVMEQLSEENKDLIREYRGQDLKKLREISIASLIPLSIVAFVGGYLIAEQNLNPLKKLNKKLQNLNVKNLNEKIEFDSLNGEVGDLIANYNKMTERMKNSFDSQREFIENASHELKTPLAIIQTNLEMALEDKTISKNELQTLIKIATKSTTFMNKLIEDLLLLAVLENDIEKETTNIFQVLDDTIESLGSIIQRRKIKILFNPKAKKINAQTNKILIQRAFTNILENAIKYSPDSSEIKIVMGKKREFVQIAITDQGEGIDSINLNRIFDRFYRVDKSRSRNTGGTGLGLAIAKKIIKAHEGVIFVKSTKGEGSKFTITIPLDKQ